MHSRTHNNGRRQLGDAVVAMTAAFESRETSRDDLDPIQRQLMELIGHGVYVTELVQRLNTAVSSGATPISRQDETELLEALERGHDVCQLAFEKFWDQTEGPLKEHFSDLLNQGWKNYAELLESIEEARWGIMNNSEDNVPDGEGFEDVDDLINALRA